MDHSNDPDYKREWDVQHVPTLVERSEDALQGTAVIEELISAYRDALDHIDKLEGLLREMIQLRETKAEWLCRVMKAIEHA